MNVIKFNMSGISFNDFLRGRVPEFENFINYQLKLEGGTYNIPRDQRICHYSGDEYQMKCSVSNESHIDDMYLK